MAFMFSTDAKDYFVNIFGPGLGTKYHVLRSQVIHVLMNRAMFVELTKNQERRHFSNQRENTFSLRCIGLS